VVALGGVAAGRWGRQGLVVGLTFRVVASLLGAMTIGLLLIPAVAATVVAVAGTPTPPLHRPREGITTATRTPSA
jgi:hypothetical protein